MNGMSGSKFKLGASHIRLAYKIQLDADLFALKKLSVADILSDGLSAPFY